MQFEDILTNEEKLLAIQAAKVRKIVMLKSRGKGLVNFHVTLGPDALFKTPEELAEEAMAWETLPHTLIEDVDGELANQPPVTNKPPMGIQEFLERFGK